MKTTKLAWAILFLIAISSCTEDDKGTNAASGTYSWNSETGVLIWNWTSSDFTCNGPELGPDTTRGVTVTSTTMTWADMDGMTWSRSSGAAGDIVGTWTAEDPGGNTYTLTFGADGTVTVTANIVDCGENSTKTASGTYTWNSMTGVLTWNFTNSDFTCNGPELGPDTITGVTITSTTMTWPGADNTVWHRSSGIAGNILGTWTFEDPDGNSYTLTFNANGTVSVRAVGIFDCENGVSANAQHDASGYRVQLNYDDPSHAATSVNVAGPGISGSRALAYNANNGEWNSWTSPSSPVDFGSAYPVGLPYTYTFSITDNTGLHTANSMVDCFQQNFATNLSPTVTASGTPTFSWTGISDPNAWYEVQLSNDGERIWDSPDVNGTTVLYSGPALNPGTTYHYNVVLNRSSACDEESFAQGSFTYQ